VRPVTQHLSNWEMCVRVDRQCAGGGLMNLNCPLGCRRGPFCSTTVQIELLLRESLHQAGRLPRHSSITMRTVPANSKEVRITHKQQGTNFARLTARA
jgi:hypothetical protein